jgi:hypothetical protein
VLSFQGLDPGPPTFSIMLRAGNRDVWRHCFKPRNGTAAVSYAGVPLV